MWLLQASQAVASAAAASAVDIPVAQLSDVERARLAKQWGYKTIGRELPDGVSLTDIVKTLPQEVRSSSYVCC